MTDGDGWLECSLGHQHWGRYGAAGLLAVAPGPYVLLQHRAAWSHDGGTWGVPGGARAGAETAEQAARRETVEETRLDLTALVVRAQHVADHGTWSYTTFVGTLPDRLPVVPERESLELRWVPVGEVADLPLHSAFAAAWPALRRLLP
ncbi:MAG: NUDIX domain-containing protein [Mycobacteriales bacterium]